MKKWIATIAVMAGLTLVLVAPSLAGALGFDDSIPGIPLGPGGVNGVVDETTDSDDYYAIRLFEGQPINLTLNVGLYTGSNSQRVTMYLLSGPNNTLADDDAYNYFWNSPAEITYVPAKSGIYYVRVEASKPGCVYKIAISGSCTLPENTTAWNTGISRGYSSTPAYGATTYVQGKLRPSFSSYTFSSGNYKFQKSNNGIDWENIDRGNLASGIAIKPVKVSAKTYYRFVFSGSAPYAASISKTIVIKPKVKVSTPIAPSRMNDTKYYNVIGYLKPRHTAGSKPVRIYKWRKNSSRRWISYGYVTATASNYYSYTKYSAKMKFGRTGQWRVRAYSLGDSSHTGTWSSGYDYITAY